jgi:tellurite resistance protein TerC
MTLAKVKRIVVTVIGFTVLIIGIVLIVFPGPAFIVIPLGLAILATEYVWARKLFEKIKKNVFKKHLINRH